MPAGPTAAKAYVQVGRDLVEETSRGFRWLAFMQLGKLYRLKGSFFQFINPDAIVDLPNIMRCNNSGGHRIGGDSKQSRWTVALGICRLRSPAGLSAPFRNWNSRGPAGSDNRFLLRHSLNSGNHLHGYFFRAYGPNVEYFRREIYITI